MANRIRSVILVMCGVAQIIVLGKYCLRYYIVVLLKTWGNDEVLQSTLDVTRGNLPWNLNCAKI